MTIGFLGLGSMGAPMAQNLMYAGHALQAWNRNREKASQLAATGATVASSPMELASCDVVFAMLANDEATRATILDSGLLAALKKTTTFVNCATISVALAQELSDAFVAAGVAYVAAPVLGRPDAAAAAKLNILAAGSDDALARVAPLFDAIGQKTWHISNDPPQANVAKIAANFLLASAIESMGEAFAICAGHGLDAQALYDVITNTLFAAPVYKNYGAQILERRFEPAGFALKLGRKDVGLAQAAGDAVGAHLPVAGALAHAFDRAIAAGDGEKDWSAVSIGALTKDSQP